MTFLHRNWWVLAFCIVTGVLYCHVIKEKSGGLHLLQTRLAAMYAEKQMVTQLNEDLELRIHSQSDPGWIEMVLMRDLGVVPEGFLKVHFKR